jgi:hypothetical protein
MSERASLFPFICRSRLEDAQRRISAYEDALAFERRLSEEVAKDRDRLREAIQRHLGIKAPPTASSAWSKPEGYLLEALRGN